MADLSSVSDPSLQNGLISERKRNLLEKGRKLGFVTDEDVISIYPKGDEYLNLIDEFATQIYELGIKIVPAEREAFIPKEAKITPEKIDDEELDAYQHYVNEIRQYPILTRSQEKWIGIAIECPRLTIDNPEFQDIVSADTSLRKKFILVLYEGICERSQALRTILSHKGIDSSKIAGYFKDLIQDTQLFQEFDLRAKGAILLKLLDIFPSSMHNHLYDLCVFLYAMPPWILQLIQDRLGRFSKIPLETEIINRLNQHDDMSEEVKAIHIRAEKARTLLILHNLRLVAFFASRYVDQGLDIMDLCQEGNLGLMKAVDKNEYRQGNKFSTYAVWWIRQSITRAIADKSNVIRLPVHVHDSIQKILRVRKEFYNESGRLPTKKELAAKSEMSLSGLSSRAKAMHRIESLDELICCQDFPLSFIGPESEMILITPCPYKEYAMRCLSNNEYYEINNFEWPICIRNQILLESGVYNDNPDYTNLMIGITVPFEPNLDRIAEEQQNKILKDVLSNELSFRQRLVINKRFGLEEEDIHTLEEISVEFGVTRERIRQIEGNAMDKLRLFRNRKRLEQYRYEQVGKR